MNRATGCLALALVACGGKSEVLPAGGETAALPPPDSTSPPLVTTPPPEDTDTPGTTPVPSLPCGTFVSALTLGGAGYEAVATSAVLADGSSWVALAFRQQMVLGAGGPNETVVDPVGNMDSLIASYDPTGAFVTFAHIESTTQVAVQRIALTSDGFVATGTLGGDATFGRGEPAETTLELQGTGNDVFVARYEASGALRWARKAGSRANDYPLDLVALAGDDVVVVGNYQGNAVFGDGEANETALPLPAGAVESGFLARYDGVGNLAWAQAVAGSAADNVKAIAVDATGTLLAVGTSVGPGHSVFAAGQAAEVDLDPGPNSGWIGRWQGDGTFDGLVVEPATSLLGIGVAPDGSSVVAGTFYESATLGQGLPTETTLTSESRDLLVARYDPAGVLLWAKQAVATSESTADPARIVALADGGAAVVGRFDGSIRLGDGEPSQVDLSTTAPFADSDAFLAHYDSTGALVCGWSIGAPGPYDSLFDLDLRPDATLLVSGTIGGATVLGAGQPTEANLVPVGSNDGLVAVYGF